MKGFITIVKILLWLLFIPVTLYLLLILINLVDQEKSPLVQSFEKQLVSHNVIADKDNGFVYLMGMNAPQQADVYQQGRENIRFFNSGVFDATSKESREALQQSFPDAVQDAFQKVQAIFPTVDNCIKELKSLAHCFKDKQDEKQQLALLLADSEQLLLRYTKLMAHLEWGEPIERSIRSPMIDYFFVLNKLHKIYVLNVWFNQEALDVSTLLDNEYRFLKNIFAKTQSTIMRMAVIDAIEQNWQLGYSLISLNNQRPIPASWQEAFGDEELSIKLILIGEWQFFKNSFSNMLIDDRVSSFSDNLLYTILSPLWLPQDTLNRYAESINNSILASDNFYQRAKLKEAGSVNCLASKGIAESLWWLKYNPIGKLITCDMSIEGYAGSSYGVEGTRRHYLVATLAKKNNVPASQILQFLDNSELKKPYDAQAFKWNQEQGTIDYIYNTPSMNGRSQIKYH